MPPLCLCAGFLVKYKHTALHTGQGAQSVVWHSRHEFGAKSEALDLGHAAEKRVLFVFLGVQPSMAQLLH